MKKTSIVIFCLPLLFALTLAGNAGAYNADYTHTIYASDYIPIIDGTYIMDDEWVASGTEYFGDNGIFRDEWTMSPNYACLLIETTDATNDAGDYWVICYDSTAEGTTTEPDGGPAPTEYDYKLVVTGHGTSATVEWFKGTGSGWTSVTPSETLCQLNQSLTETPKIETEHYVLELAIDKSDTSLGSYPMGYNWAQYVAYYDAHQGGNGLQQWPPTPASADVPDSWGYIIYEMAMNPEPDIPETTGFIVMLTLSSVAVAGAVFLGKRKK